MYSKQEASLLTQQFWTSFGQYMQPVPGADGKVNWLNYHTGVRDMFFRMEVHNNAAIISILLAQKDDQRQTALFNQLLQLKAIFEDLAGKEWTWENNVFPDGKGCRIYQSCAPVSIYNKDDWPRIISFFKPRIIQLDAFWQTVKWNFQQ